MTEFLMLALKLCVVAMVVAIGLGSKLADLDYLLRRPALLLRALVAMYVVVPVATFLLVKWLPITAAAKAALLVLAVSAGAPLLPRKLLFLDSGKFVFGLAVISSLLAVVVAPAWVALLAGHFGVAAELPATRVATVIATGFVVPLALGMVAHALAPAVSERLAEKLLAVGGAVMLACGVALLVQNFGTLREVDPLGLVAIGIVMATALAAGHLLGGPDPDDRTVLAVACATRHIGIAVLVAASFPGPRTAALIVAYLMVALLVSTPYLRHRKRRRTEAAGVAPVT